jgi:hypothetical protein
VMYVCTQLDPTRAASCKVQGARRKPWPLPTAHTHPRNGTTLCGVCSAKPARKARTFSHLKTPNT